MGRMLAARTTAAAAGSTRADTTAKTCGGRSAAVNDDREAQEKGALREAATQPVETPAAVRPSPDPPSMADAEMIAAVHAWGKKTNKAGCICFACTMHASKQGKRMGFSAAYVIFSQITYYGYPLEPRLRRLDTSFHAPIRLARNEPPRWQLPRKRAEPREMRHVGI